MTSSRAAGRQHVQLSARLAGLAVVLASVLALSAGVSPAAASPGWSNPTLLDPWWVVDGASCASSSHCVAVGNNVLNGGALKGLASSYNGTSWTVGASVSGTTQLQAVSCPSTTHCLAVGGSDAVIDNEGHWEASQAIDSGGHLLAVSCGSEAFCVATDEEGYATIYKNGTWGTREDIDGSSTLPSVSCAGEFCAAVDGRGYALIYSGGKWSTPEEIDPSHALSAVSCLSGGYCIAVDNAGNELTYGAGKWGAPTNIDGTTHLISVSCFAESRCLASGEGQGTLVDSGGTWTLGTTAEGMTSCVPASTFCVVTNAGGYTTDYSAGSWTTPEEFGGEFGNVSCIASSYCLATDETGHYLVYSAGSWSERKTVQANWRYGGHPLSCVSESFCIAVAGEHPVQFNGTTWTTITEATDAAGLVSISCTSETFCVAGDADGDYLVDHGGVWSTPTATGDGGNAIEALSCSTETFCMAADAGKTLQSGETLIYNGSTWGAPEAMHVSYSGSDANNLSCAPDAKFCVASTEGKRVETYSKGAWRAPINVGFEDASLVSCASESFCIAQGFTGSGRVVSTYNGTNWSAPQTLPGTENNGPWALSCGSPNLCVLLEEDGQALVYSNTLTLPPVNTAPPTITGTDEEGQTLTEHHGTWTNTPTEYSVQWERCNASGVACSVVASGSSYVLTGADVGSTVRASETASNGAGPGSPADSEPTPVVVAPKGSGGGGSTGSGGSGGSGATAMTAQVVTPVVLAPVVAVPVVGQRQTVSPVSGTVLVRVKGASGFVALSAATSITEGSEVEATNGRVTITVATPTGTQSAEVYGGRFVVEQEHGGSDETRFVLSLPLTGCPRVALPRGASAASAKHGPKSRHLWVSESGGSWGTNGRYVSTTVEGTHWLTQDECNQSEVQVLTGKVKVNDLVTHKTKTLTAGQHYTTKRR